MTGPLLIFPAAAEGGDGIAAQLKKRKIADSLKKGLTRCPEKLFLKVGRRNSRRYHQQKGGGG